MGNQEAVEMIFTMIFKVLQGLNETDEFFTLLASMSRKLFDALLDAGFTEDQAIQIVAGFAARGGK